MKARVLIESASLVVICGGSASLLFRTASRNFRRALARDECGASFRMPFENSTKAAASVGNSGLLDEAIACGLCATAGAVVVDVDCEAILLIESMTRPIKMSPKRPPKKTAQPNSIGLLFRLTTG